MNDTTTGDGDVNGGGGGGDRGGTTYAQQWRWWCGGVNKEHQGEKQQQQQHVVGPQTLHFYQFNDSQRTRNENEAPRRFSLETQDKPISFSSPPRRGGGD